MIRKPLLLPIVLLLSYSLNLQAQDDVNGGLAVEE